MSYPQRLEADNTPLAEVVPLDAIPTAWDKAWFDLARHASEPNPFAENWFMRPAIAHLGGIAGGQMIAVWQQNRLLGLLPFVAVGQYGRLPIQHVENWMHYHCFYGAPLIRAGYETVFWKQLTATLDAATWAPNFLHLVALDPHGPAFLALRDVRQADIVHRSERAMLKSDLDPQSYFAANARSKKRKEIKRLRSRLDELGTVQFASFSSDASVKSWSEDFLALEASGWKGREGSALGGQSSTADFFKAAVAGGHAAGKLDMLRLTLDGKPIAMLINFLTPPGSFAFKIAFDENYARFSPGVLIKIENLKILNDRDILWTDSCAVEGHSMINSLWAERREIVRVTVPLAGLKRKTVFRGARMIENAAALLRGRR